MSDKGIEMLKRSEGVELRPYKDTTGKWTVGVGHLMLPNDEMKDYSEVEVNTMLKSDLKLAEDTINRLVLVPLTQTEFDALVHFTFNVGIRAFKLSTLLRKLNNKQYIGAANEFMAWTKQKELIGRRKKERNLFLNEVYS